MCPSCKKNWIDHLIFKHCFYSLSYRGLNRDTTNRQPGWVVQQSPHFLSFITTHTHTHSNHCNVSSLIKLCYDTDSILQFDYIHHWNTHTNNTSTFTYHVISCLKPKAELGWEVRCLIALIHACNTRGRKYVSFLKRKKKTTHIWHTLHYTHSMMIMCTHIHANILLFRVCSFTNSIPPALVHSHFLCCHWMKL